MSKNHALQDSKFFQDYKVVDILNYYDGPKIFTFLTKTNDLFLAYYVDDSDDFTGEEFLFVPTSQESLDRLTEGKLSIKGFFREAGFLYKVTMTSTEILEIENRWFYQIEDDIPEEGVFLKYSANFDSTLSEKKNCLKNS
jgi:hypothetical protein